MTWPVTRVLQGMPGIVCESVVNIPPRYRSRAEAQCPPGLGPPGGKSQRGVPRMATNLHIGNPVEPPWEADPFSGVTASRKGFSLNRFPVGSLCVSAAGEGWSRPGVWLGILCANWARCGCSRASERAREDPRWGGYWAVKWRRKVGPPR